MKAYHGSHQSGLKKLTYTEENSRFGGDANLVHGAGIYLTLSKEEAKAYATSSLYTLEISGEVFNATDEEVLSNFVLQLCNSWDISKDILSNSNIQSLIKRTACGDISGVAFAKNVSDIFSNDINLYSEILHSKFNDDLDALLDATESFFHYKLIQIRHKGNGTDWIICIDHEGTGIAVVSEEINQ
jgi:hypothetical protein